MATENFYIRNDIKITDIIEGDEQSVISSKSIATFDRKKIEGSNFGEYPKTNPVFDYTISTNDNWAQDVEVQFIQDENDVTNSYKKIQVTNIPKNDAEDRKDRTLIIDIRYELNDNKNITTRPIKYEVYQKRYLIKIFIQGCKYEAIVFTNRSYIKIWLNGDEQGNNLLIGYGYPSGSPEYQLTEAIKDSLLTYKKNLKFNLNNNKVEIPVNNSEYTRFNFEIPSDSEQYMTLEPLELDNANFKFYFKFNNNIHRKLGVIFTYLNTTNLITSNSYPNYEFHFFVKDNVAYLNANDLIYNDELRFYIQWQYLKAISLFDKSLIDTTQDKDKIKIILETYIQFVPDPASSQDNTIYIYAVNIEFIFQLQDTYENTKLFPTPITVDSNKGFKIYFPNDNAGYHNKKLYQLIINQGGEGINQINLFKFRKVVYNSQNTSHISFTDIVQLAKVSFFSDEQLKDFGSVNITVQ